MTMLFHLGVVFRQVLLRVAADDVRIVADALGRRRVRVLHHAHEASPRWRMSAAAGRRRLPAGPRLGVGLGTTLRAEEPKNFLGNFRVTVMLAITVTLAGRRVVERRRRSTSMRQVTRYRLLYVFVIWDVVEHYSLSIQSQTHQHHLLITHHSLIPFQ